MDLKNAFIQVRISQETSIGKYNDALYYSPEQFEKLEEKDLQAAIDKRVNDWIAFVQEQSSKPPYVPTKEELKEQTAIQANQIGVLTDQLIAATPTKAEAQSIIDKLTESVDKLKVITAVAVGEVKVIK